MTPHLEILPAAQLAIWPKLKDVPENYILYGGTAIALQLGHRESVDFDFFSAQPLDKQAILQALPFLATSHIVQPEINTLNIMHEVNGDFVKFQFLAGFGKRIARIEEYIICDDYGLKMASLRDLLGTKLNTIQACAEAKDYIDIDALLQNGFTIDEGLGCAQAIYGQTFDPSTSLRALCSFRDGDLPDLAPEIQERLINASQGVATIPQIAIISATI